MAMPLLPPSHITLTGTGGARVTRRTRALVTVGGAEVVLRVPFAMFQRSILVLGRDIRWVARGGAPILTTLFIADENH